jgi:hypothetical protein
MVYTLLWLVRPFSPQDPFKERPNIVELCYDPDETENLYSKLSSFIGSCKSYASVLGEASNLPEDVFGHVKACFGLCRSCNLLVFVIVFIWVAQWSSCAFGLQMAKPDVVFREFQGLVQGVLENYGECWKKGKSKESWLQQIATTAFFPIAKGIYFGYAFECVGLNVF